MSLSSEQSISILRDALAEVQATIRAYDTKAQIVGVGFVFALGIVDSVERLVPNESEIGLFGVAFAWMVVILPILLFGHVLYPSRRTAPQLETNSEKQPESVLYPDTVSHETVDGYRQSLARCDIIDEYAYEVLRLSQLRDIKRQRFVRALFLAAAAFIFLFSSQLIRMHTLSGLT